MVTAHDKVDRDVSAAVRQQPRLGNFILIRAGLSQQGGSMTAQEARKKVEQRLAREVSEDYPLIWVGGVFAETRDAFIIEGATYSGKDDLEECMVCCAVHKESGRCGIIAPPPGPIIGRDYLEQAFSWERWAVVE